MICPLCSSRESSLFDQDKYREFYKCLNCSLVYVPRSALLSTEEEKERYEHHQNSISDPGYHAYLSKIANSIVPYLKKGDRGLDFGCGCTTLLGELISKTNPTESYDLYFFPDSDLWDKKYDFIILSEVIEHLADPLETMKKLSRLLNDDGQIFIKTKFYPDNQMSFSKWFYKRDLTHVQFFSKTANDQLLEKLALSRWEEIGEDLYLFK